MTISHPRNITNAEFLVGYPRSGNNWTIALLQLLIGKEVRDANDPHKTRKDYVLNRLDLPLDESKPILYRAHDWPRALRKIDTKNNKLIVVIRNFKECLVRHNQYSPKQLLKATVGDGGEFKRYEKILKLFERWDENNRFMIFYEDLILYPKKTVACLLDFLDEKPDHMDEFFENFDYWKNKTLTSYKNQHGHKNSSGGKSPIFHIKDFPLKTLKKIDNHIKKTHPLLWKKYLYRYES